MGEGARRARLREQPERPLPEQARLGLLNYITAHALDEDYAHVSEQRARASSASSGEPPEAPRRPPLWSGRLATFGAVAAFGLLAATAAVQAARTEPLRESSRESLTTQVAERRAELAERRATLVTLRRDVADAQAAALEASQAGRTIQERLAGLGAAAGTVALTGPGVRIQVDNSRDPTRGQVVLDTDLQRLVNGLWTSGAEAIAINGQRLTALSSIRVAGEAITVNLRSLTRPYVVRAIGDPDTLAAAFLDSDGGSWWLNLRSLYDLQFEMTTEESLTVPAVPELDLRHAVAGGPQRSRQ